MCSSDLVSLRLAIDDDALFILRAEEGIIIDGKPEGNEAPVKPGAQIQVGEVTFTVTPLAVERS